jgi:Flp pilus assembly protein protease CpaA
MLEHLAFLTALVGSVVGAAYDLKTTEIPDKIFYVMFAVGLVIVAINSYISSSIWPLLISTVVGSVLFAFGFLMYKAGQWGGADAKLLAVIGFLLPTTPSFMQETYFPFPLSYLINVFLIGTPYMLLYAVVVAAKNKKIIEEFSKDMKASSKMIFISSIVLFTAFIALSFYFASLFNTQLPYEELVKNSLLPVFATIALFVVFKFAKSVEDVGFKRKIPVSRLRVGDVLNESREIEGITKKELERIKKSGKKFVVIKEGVRFGPAFPLALLFTLFYGDGILFLIRFLI